GEVRPAFRKALGDSQADLVGDMLKEYLGGGSLGEKLEEMVGGAGGGEDPTALLDQYLNDRETLRAQFEELLGEENMRGDLGRQLDEALSDARLPDTLSRILGGDNAPPGLKPYIAKLRERAKAAGGGAGKAAPGGAAKPAPAAPQVGPEALKQGLQESLRAGKLPPGMRQLLGEEYAEIADEQLAQFLAGGTLKEKLEAVVAEESDPKAQLEQLFGKTGEVRVALEELLSNSPEAQKSLDSVFTDSVPGTLQNLLGNEPLPDAVKKLYPAEKPRAGGAAGAPAKGGPGKLAFKAAAAAGGGVAVTVVEEGGPAARAGLKTGDVVRSINGKPIASMDDVKAVLGGVKAGDSFALDVLRGKEKKSIAIVADPK
ncbi:MAG: PDZ domain-containing protein, partial [Planctomycetes bacterium]|nr:PDZ domain-containing protein [Planctomycetota bacterium]